MDLVTITAITSVTGLTLTVLLLGGGGVLYIWKLSSRVDHLSYRIDRLEEGLAETREELRTEMRETREEIRQEMRELRTEMHEVREVMRAEIREVREEMRAEMREMREEMRRNQEQLLVALAAHSHDDTGQAAFRNPL